MKKDHQKLPSSGPEREALREKGQFWTPKWVAKAMVNYVLGDQSTHIFDPAVGAGAFFIEAKGFARQFGKNLELYGTELHGDVLEKAKQNGLSNSDLRNVEIRDFVLNPPDRRFHAIVANPPYIRHHRLTMSVKTQLRSIAKQQVGRTLDGRAGIHIYFLLRALNLLDENGRLAFIMPSDTVEGVFAPILWRWITNNFRLDAIITFSGSASPFPEVDTNALVFLIRNSIPSREFWWARCTDRNGDALYSWVNSGFKLSGNSSLLSLKRDIIEGLETGFSRQPQLGEGPKFRLGDFANVMRGIATGDNKFFLLTRKRANEIGIPNQFLLPAISRTRDVISDELTRADLERLEDKGRPTLLVALDGRPVSEFPLAVRRYIEDGESSGLAIRPLIATRKPWYKMETRRIPPILFAYLGRRSVRFVRNKAGVVPLTGFLCVYPKSNDPNFVDRLWRVLSHPKTISNLVLVAKSYGRGALKVEPRSLEKLPFPDDVCVENGLTGPCENRQFDLVYSN